MVNYPYSFPLAGIIRAGLAQAQESAVFLGIEIVTFFLLEIFVCANPGFAVTGLIRRESGR
jgi:hypothetical protein